MDYIAIRKYYITWLFSFCGIYLYSSVKYIIVVISFLVIGCGSTLPPAPVVDRVLGETKQPVAHANNQESFYIVKRGDTLYSISADNGIDLRELAEWNGIANPSAINPGQRISLSIPTNASSQRQHVQPILSALPQSTLTTSKEASEELSNTINQVKTEPIGLKLPYSDATFASLHNQVTNSSVITPLVVAPVANNIKADNKDASTRIEVAPAAVAVVNARLDDSGIKWMWPTEGNLFENFSSKTKGVKISGQSGQDILASAAGQVVYSGNGLRGYGKLLIIKHNNIFISAYAHNRKILAQEGDDVTRGQKIAEMGDTDANTVQLHFEIRKRGKPVDPLKFLPREH